MKVGGASLNPVSPCAPWCSIPDPEESGFELDAIAETHPWWCCPKVDLTDPGDYAKAVWAGGAASSLLFRMSGNRFNGGCTGEEVLCLRRDTNGCWRLGWGEDWRSRPFPSGDGATWLNETCSRRGCDCATGRRRIQLPYGPVIAINSLTIGDALIDEADYELVGDSIYLCADVDPAVCFDACAGTGLIVDWTWGQAPPPEGVTAACVLSCELYNACSGGPCRLPRRVQQVAKPGLTYTKLNPLDLFKAGVTGIDEIDLFLLAWGTTAPTTVTFPEDVAPIDFDSRARARW